MPGNDDGGLTEALSRSAQAVKRHLEGWQLGAATVTLVFAFAALGVPRGSEPDVFPLPTIDRKAVARIERREAERADDAERAPLSFDVRAAGEAFRRYGRFAALGNANSALRERDAFRERVRSLLQAKRESELLKLRAVQTRFFLQALRAFEATGETTRELNELSGDFIAQSERRGLLQERELSLTELERSLLFRMRWNELAGVREQFPFAATQNEWRVYYRFLLEHPERHPATDGEHSAILARLRYVAALEKRDPSYFAELARGVLLYQLGAFLPAAEALRAHLARHPDGPWQLRARNYLIHTLQKTEHSELGVE